MITRRSFLAIGGTATAALVLDPERLLWVPGAKTFFFPSTTLVEATTLADALRQGFIATFPDGAVMEIRIGRSNDGLTLDERIAAERAAVRRMGGRIVRNLQWEQVPVSYGR